MCYCDGYSGLAIADYFIQKAIDANIPITNMAILKMIYFAHGFSYPELDRKLIRDPFYAWKWGPVEINTYKEFSKYGSGSIASVSGKTAKELENISTKADICEFLDKLMALAEVSPFILSEKTHEKGAPWDETPSFNEISDDLIRNYFCRKSCR